MDRNGADHTTTGRREALRAFVAERLVFPAQAFVATEASSGALLLLATVAALVWANSPWDGAYHDLWATQLRADFELFSVQRDLAHVVNEGLMTVFFFVAGLEIKRELVQGELSSPRKAALPVAAALGGMLAPALIYLAVNAGGEGSDGWGVPMATDIAFALGALALLGRRVPFALKVFVLALAIVDDLGAIVVIAVFYSESIAWAPVFWAVGVVAAIIAAGRMGVRATYVYLVLGVLLWLAVVKSGLHPTLAGVVLALLTPSRTEFAPDEFEASAAGLIETYRGAHAAADPDAEQAVLSEFERLTRGSESPLDRLERGLHPWVSYAIVPLFALANAGASIGGGAVGDAFQGRVGIGIALGLVLGKPLGIVLFTAIALRLGFGSLPTTVGFVHIIGAGILAGIGFTVSLFVTGLAFDAAPLQADARIAVLGASLAAGVVGYIYLWIAPGEPDPA